MKRLNFKALLGGICVLLALGLLFWCMHRPVKAGSVQVILHGPTLTENGEDAITVFVPGTNGKIHVLVAPDVVTSQTEKTDQPESDDCNVTVALTLEGVTPSHGVAKVADAFDGVRFPVRKDWTPSWDKLRAGRAPDARDPFVRIMLPSADKIDYLNPRYPIEFESGQTAAVPLTEVIEFPATNMDKVRLVQKRTTVCGGKKRSETVQNLQPMSCEDVRKRYSGYFNAPESRDSEQAYSERPYLKEKFEKCRDGMYFYFVGVGLPPTTGPDEQLSHGIDFFNNQLLPEVYGGKDNIPEGKRLKVVVPRKGEGWRPELRPAVFRYPAPVLRPVASTENCTAPGVIVTHE